MTAIQRLALALRALMEFAIVIALAYWGYHVGNGMTGKVALAIAAPAVGFGLWGAVDFRRAGRFAEVLRLVEELAISGAAAVLWYVAGQHVMGVALGALSIVHHVLVYASGDRLLRT